MLRVGALNSFPKTLFSKNTYFQKTPIFKEHFFRVYDISGRVTLSRTTMVLDEHSVCFFVLCGLEFIFFISYQRWRDALSVFGFVILGVSTFIFYQLKCRARKTFPKGFRPSSGTTTPLHRASALGNFKRVSCLSASSADVNAWDGDGLTALHLAVMHGHPIAVKCLIAAGVEVEKPTYYENKTPLILAAESENLYIFKLLVAAHALVDQEEVYGATKGRETCITEFLDQGTGFICNMASPDHIMAAVTLAGPARLCDTLLSVEGHALTAAISADCASFVARVAKILTKINNERQFDVGALGLDLANLTLQRILTEVITNDMLMAYVYQGLLCAECNSCLLPLKRCARCENVRYCSKACQSAHRPAHTRTCEPCEGIGVLWVFISKIY
jgi:hypothetical protein